MSLKRQINEIRSPLNLAYSALFSSCFPGGYLQALQKSSNETMYDIEERQILRHMDTQVEYLPKGFDLFVPDLTKNVDMLTRADDFFHREIVKAEHVVLDYILEPECGDILPQLKANPLNTAASFIRGVENEKTIVVCWSGGMDSLSAALHAITHKRAEKLVLIHTNYNGPYSPKESGRAYQTYEALIDLASNLRNNPKTKVALRKITYMELKIGIESMAESLLPLGYIMPGRNGFIATSILDVLQGLDVLHTLPEIYMTGHYRSVEGQYTGAVDKNYHFFGEMSNIYFWNKRFSSHVTSPFLSISKEEMLSYGYTYLMGKTQFSKEVEQAFFKCIDSTVSCYDPVYDRCGNCSSCYKRWQALKTLPAYKEVYNIPVEQAPRYQEFAARENKKGR
ncbi:7-cyano-7-deazaguanine synthase [Ewingella americana]|nr:7-cyano-7-deazaguanine synthase [Ewingella americana]